MFELLLTTQKRTVLSKSDRELVILYADLIKDEFTISHNHGFKEAY